MKIVSPETMKRIDKRTMDEFGINSRILMENAGKGCAEYIRDHILPRKGNVICFSGTGNNGGDGFVIARWLAHWHYPVQVVLLGNPEKMTEESRANLELCNQMDIEVIRTWDVISVRRLSETVEKSACVIDAIFGIGFKGKLEDYAIEAVNVINAHASLIVSIDIPSGLDSFTGNSETCVHAHYTLTLGAWKYGLILNKGMSYCGSTHLIDIGLPDKYFGEEQSAELLAREDVIFPARNRLNHKGSYGRIAVIAGSPGFAGAALMSSKACLRAVLDWSPSFIPKVWKWSLRGRSWNS